MMDGGCSSKLHVLFLTKGLGPGGMERLLVHHVRTGDRERFEYHAAHLVDRPDSVISELEALGASCTRLGTGGGSDPRWLRDLVSLVRHRNIDVVHAHSPQPAALSRPVLRALRHGPRLVYTEHNSWDCYGVATRLANAATYPLDHAEFVVSAAARESVPTFLRRRVEVLTHGIDLEAVRSAGTDPLGVRYSLGISSDEIVITNVAHLRREKAHEVLLGATATLLETHPEVVVLSLGHGPREVELKNMAATLGLGDRFRFLGFREDALAILGASDVFCLSSHQEGLPVAFMEASALGLPTVATRVGGLPDHILDGSSGLLVAPDDPGALSVALARLVADRAFREQMGNAAAEQAGKFDARFAVKRQEAVYGRLCGRIAKGSDDRYGVT